MRVLYDLALSRIEELEKRLYDPHIIYPEKHATKQTPCPDVETLKSNLGKEGYMKVVERMKEHVTCGGIL